VGKLSSSGLRAVVCAGFRRKPERNGNLQKPSLIAGISVLEDVPSDEDI